MTTNRIPISISDKRKSFLYDTVQSLRLKLILPCCYHTYIQKDLGILSQWFELKQISQGISVVFLYLKQCIVGNLCHLVPGQYKHLEWKTNEQENSATNLYFWIRVARIWWSWQFLIWLSSLFTFPLRKTLDTVTFFVILTL